MSYFITNFDNEIILIHVSVQQQCALSEGVIE